eukprot:ANDGO_05148.mRNA.1 hypothetical protein
MQNSHGNVPFDPFQAWNRAVEQSSHPTSLTPVPQVPAALQQHLIQQGLLAPVSQGNLQQRPQRTLPKLPVVWRHNAAEAQLMQNQQRSTVIATAVLPRAQSEQNLYPISQDQFPELGQTTIRDFMSRSARKRQLQEAQHAQKLKEKADEKAAL